MRTFLIIPPQTSIQLEKISWFASAEPSLFQEGKQLWVSNKCLQHQLSRFYFNFSSPQKFPLYPNPIFFQKR